mmetsp:Transcript_1463/g.2273  ORF Transcript_1463/g.2273 Transcript_1463/m.2273 type:complete len:249 (+) Transcript_1463:192-938(+)
MFHSRLKLFSPTKIIRNSTILNACDVVINRLGNFKCMWAFNCVLLVLEHKSPHRRNYSSRASSKSVNTTSIINSLCDLVNTNPPLHCLPVRVQSRYQLQDTGTSDSWKDCATKRGGSDLKVIALFENKEHVHCSNFLNIFSLHSIQPQGLGTAMIACPIRTDDRGSVVSSSLSFSSSPGSGTSVFITNPNSEGLKGTRLVVSSNRAENEKEKSLGSGLNTQTRLSGDHGGANVKTCSSLRGDKLSLNF